MAKIGRSLNELLINHYNDYDNEEKGKLIIVSLLKVPVKYYLSKSYLMNQESAIKTKKKNFIRSLRYNLYESKKSDALEDYLGFDQESITWKLENKLSYSNQNNNSSIETLVYKIIQRNKNDSFNIIYKAFNEGSENYLKLLEQKNKPVGYDLRLEYDSILEVLKRYVK